MLLYICIHALTFVMSNPIIIYVLVLCYSSQLLLSSDYFQFVLVAVMIILDEALIESDLISFVAHPIIIIKFNLLLLCTNYTPYMITVHTVSHIQYF